MMNASMMDVHYLSVRHSPDIEYLYHRFDSLEDSMLLVSRYFQ